ncbi:MAG: rhomboid family intramembrane serine protease [Armatimonadetes bacterium]|nr:rhomboid family intramembrane serine protease [Armatimonadota bacterium]
MASGHLAIPTVGASGAVSAVLGAYIVLCPAKRVRLAGLVMDLPVTFKVAAFWVIGWWFGLQLFSGGEASVAYGAHVGGFIAGGVLTAILVMVGGVEPSWHPPAAAALAESAPPPAEMVLEGPACPGCLRPFQTVTIGAVNLQEWCAARPWKLVRIAKGPGSRKVSCRRSSTVYDDTASPRPGQSDLFVEPAAQQAELRPPDRILYYDQPALIPLEL